MTISVIVFDVDGVLVPKKTASPMPVPLIRKVKSLERTGAKCGMASGRTIGFLRGIANMVGMTGPLMSECGSLLFIPEDFRGHGVMKMEGFTEKEALEIKETLLKNVKGVEFSLSRFKLFEACAYPRKVEDAGRLHEKCVKALGGRDDVTIFHSGISVDIVKKGVSKGNAMKRASELMNVPLGKFAAIGDSENDIDMLRKAGFSACPADATPEIMKVANYVAKKPGPLGTLEALGYMERSGMI